MQSGVTIISSGSYPPTYPQTPQNKCNCGKKPFDFQRLKTNQNLQQCTSQLVTSQRLRTPLMHRLWYKRHNLERDSLCSTNNTSKLIQLVCACLSIIQSSVKICVCVPVHHIPFVNRVPRLELGICLPCVFPEPTREIPT